MQIRILLLPRAPNLSPPNLLVWPTTHTTEAGTGGIGVDVDVGTTEGTADAVGILGILGILNHRLLTINAFGV